MSEERLKILNMLADGKISVSEAEELLKAIGQSGSDSENAGVKDQSAKKPEYLHIKVNPDCENGGKEKVNIKVPLRLLRAGVKLASVMPKGAGHKVHHALNRKGIDIDWDKFDSENFEEIIKALRELEIDVDDDGEKVQIRCE